MSNEALEHLFFTDQEFLTAFQPDLNTQVNDSLFGESLNNLLVQDSEYQYSGELVDASNEILSAHVDWVAHDTSLVNPTLLSAPSQTSFQQQSNEATNAAPEKDTILDDPWLQLLSDNHQNEVDVVDYLNTTSKDLECGPSKEIEESVLHYNIKDSDLEQRVSILADRCDTIEQVVQRLQDE